MYILHPCLFNVTHVGGPNFIADDVRLAVGGHSLDITISTELGQELSVPTLGIIIPGLFHAKLNYTLPLPMMIFTFLSLYRGGAIVLSHIGCQFHNVQLLFTQQRNRHCYLLI